MPRATWTVGDRAVRTGNTFYSLRLRKHRHCLITGVRNGVVSYRRLTGDSSSVLTATRAQFEVQFGGWGPTQAEIHAERMRLAQIEREVASVWHEAHVENFARDLARLGGEETVQRFRDLLSAQDEVGAERGVAEYMDEHYCGDSDYYSYY